jgi:hypothetical protein
LERKEKKMTTSLTPETIARDLCLLIKTHEMTLESFRSVLHVLEHIVDLPLHPVYPILTDRAEMIPTVREYLEERLAMYERTARSLADAEVLEKWGTMTNDERRAVFRRPLTKSTSEAKAFLLTIANKCSGENDTPEHKETLSHLFDLSFATVSWIEKDGKKIARKDADI